MRQDHYVIFILPALKILTHLPPQKNPIHYAMQFKLFLLKIWQKTGLFLNKLLHLFTECYSSFNKLVNHRKKCWKFCQKCLIFFLRTSCIFPLLQEIQATWYEKLHEWEDALVAYDKKIDMNKGDPELILGRMRCLEALGEW